MSKSLKYYLAGYNFIAFTFWGLYLVYFIASGLQLDIYGQWLLNIAQGLAILEILHAALKWVKSPLGSTIAQVASRLLVVVLIDIHLYADGVVALPFRNPDVAINMRIAVIHFLQAVNYGIIIVSFAWSITELVRYSLYYLGLFNRQPKWLLWMRYSFFIVLYPLGVTGEWLIIAAPLFLAWLINLTAYYYFAGFLLLVYAYYFPVLYRYMWRQRKAKLV
jgi:very-long-chain (3R)-3-hydroxyacyl-CoA dehydratase